MSKVKITFIDGTIKIEDMDKVKRISIEEMQKRYIGKAITNVEFIEDD